MKCSEVSITEVEEEEYDENWCPPCPVCGAELTSFEPDFLDFPFQCPKCGTELMNLPNSDEDPDMEYGLKICPISKPSPSALEESKEASK